MLTCLAIALFCLIYPMYVIRPFRHQGAGELQLALGILRFRGGVEVLASIGALIGLAGLWRANGIARKIVGVFATLAVFACAALSRVNVFEIMFHPIGKPSFAPVAESKLDGDEKVVAIETGGAARAYPIRIVSYHHIVNDLVGGVPIAATY